MSEIDPNDAALVARTRRGDAAAFDTLVRRHYRAAYAVALAVLCHREDAEDVCQESWVRALERIEDCRQPERFIYWFLQIVRNRARNRLDHRRVRSAEPLDSPAAAAIAAEAPEPAVETGPLRARLEEALGSLSEVQRAIVLLHDLEGWTHRAIATEQGISELMSRQHLFQARRRLRARLGEAILEELKP